MSLPAFVRLDAPPAKLSFGKGLLATSHLRLFVENSLMKKSSVQLCEFGGILALHTLRMRFPGSGIKSKCVSLIWAGRLVVSISLDGILM